MSPITTAAPSLRRREVVASPIPEDPPARCVIAMIAFSGNSIILPHL